MDGTGTVDPATGEATVKTDAGGTVGGEVAPQGLQGQETNAGGSQGSSEGGKVEGTDTRPQFRSKNQTIFELRQKLRERDSYWESEVGTLKEQLAEIQKMFGRGQERKPSRTFYEAPEDTLREIQQEGLSEHLKSFKQELLTELRQTEEQRAQAQDWKQETSEAVKFVRGMKGITDDDVREISELIREDPTFENMRPMQAVKYALYMYEQEKGVSDRTSLKNRAAGVQGSGQSNGGPRIWTETEMESEYRKLGDPKTWDAEIKKKAQMMETEFMNAYREKRVKK